MFIMNLRLIKVIVQKKYLIKVGPTGILEPFSDQGNIEMFSRAGFKDIECIFTNINFKG